MSARAAIWGSTLAVIAGYVAAIWLADRFLVARWIDEPALSIAFSFALVQTVAILVMLGALFLRRGVATARRKRSEELAKEIQEALAEHAAGRDRYSLIESLRKRSRRDVERGIVLFAQNVKGPMRDRVLALQRRKRTREAGDIPRNLLERAVRADELLPLASDLVLTDVPDALAGGDREDMIIALDFLRAWRRHWPIANYDVLLAHPDEEIRERAWLALPYVHPEGLAGLRLDDASPRVRIAIARTAGKLRMIEALPRLRELVRDPDREVALAAAFAMAALPEGLAALQELMVADRDVAAVAFEAIEKATLGRLDVA